MNELAIDKQQQQQQLRNGWNPTSCETDPSIVFTSEITTFISIQAVQHFAGGRNNKQILQSRFPVFNSLETRLEVNQVQAVLRVSRL